MAEIPKLPSCSSPEALEAATRPWSDTSSTPPRPRLRRFCKQATRLAVPPPPPAAILQARNPAGGTGSQACRIAVLMNEFGELAIDSRVINGKNIDVIELAGGCVCCSMTGEFEAAIGEIARLGKLGFIPSCRQVSNYWMGE